MGLLENMWIIKTFLYVVISMSYELEINSFCCYWDSILREWGFMSVRRSEARSRDDLLPRCGA